MKIVSSTRGYMTIRAVHRPTSRRARSSLHTTKNSIVKIHTINIENKNLKNNKIVNFLIKTKI